MPKPAPLYVAAYGNALHTATTLAGVRLASPAGAAPLALFRLQRERKALRVFRVRPDDRPVEELTGEARASLLGELGVC